MSICTSVFAQVRQTFCKQRRQAEFSAWEQQVAKQRNQGQFFQGLYEVDKNSDRESKKQIPKIGAAQVEVRIENKWLPYTKYTTYCSSGPSSARRVSSNLLSAQLQNKN